MRTTITLPTCLLAAAVATCRLVGQEDGMPAGRDAPGLHGELGFGSTNGSRRAHHQGDALL